MSSDDIVTLLCSKVGDPSEVVYAITMRDIITAVVQRLQGESLQLTAEDLLLARDELQAIFGHYLDERELFDLALNQWEVVRKL